MTRDELMNIRMDPPMQRPVERYLLNLGSVSVAEECEERDQLFRMITLVFRGHDPIVLKSYQTFLLAAAGHLNIRVAEAGELLPKYVLWRRTLLRSAHVHKSARVQYETRTYRRKVALQHLTGSTADTYLEYVERNLPEGVSLQVIKRELLEFTPHIRSIFERRKT